MADDKHHITVSASVAFVPEQSDVDESRYVFAYTITMKVQEVKGEGVVGEQPLLRPGQSFEYTSGAAIATPVGTMRGSYQMVAEDGLRFDRKTVVPRCSRCLRAR